ncbi:hypothetical protein GFS31_11480 [Leptolyngbya sp. BL0902]|nr:hypothetical protein GFS31_11480 [Leptolyngbya sp. BL0902]
MALHYISFLTLARCQAIRRNHGYPAAKNPKNYPDEPRHR